MSETKFTPGPWKVEKELFAKSYQWLISYDTKSKGRGIAVAETVVGTGKELANARLIAAAPDLYTELETLVTELEALWDEGKANDLRLYEAEDWEQEQEAKWLANIKTAKSALAKTRGEQP